MIGSHLIKTYAKTLAVLALSSGEAELMSLVKASAEGMGVQAICRDFQENVSIEVQSDASAAIGMVRRKGLGKVRHLATSDLWVQSKQAAGDIVYAKVNGKDNPADAFTKGLDEATLVRHMQAIGVYRLTGRAEVAPAPKSSTVQ